MGMFGSMCSCSTGALSLGCYHFQAIKYGRNYNRTLYDVLLSFLFLRRRYIFSHHISFSLISSVKIGFRLPNTATLGLRTQYQQTLCSISVSFSSGNTEVLTSVFCNVATCLHIALLYFSMYQLFLSYSFFLSCCCTFSFNENFDYCVQTSFILLSL